MNPPNMSPEPKDDSESLGHNHKHDHDDQDHDANPRPKKHRRSRYDPEPDYSAQIREKVKNSTVRTGQACDRCKQKRTKCTPEVNGCACCLGIGVPCKVTDRVTGETFVRGAAGRLNALNEQLLKEIEEQKQVILNWKLKCEELQQEMNLLRAPVDNAYDQFGFGSGLQF